ncbi:TPR-like protein [Trichoderma evansii]
MLQRPSSREDFEVAIICALPLEFDAVVLLFDEFWDKDGDIFGRAIGDLNTYTTGRIGKHNIVLALLSQMGKANAAAAAANMRSSYGALRLVIIAGICGGVPSNSQGEMFLGDVVISKSIIQYDFGRKYPDGFMRKTGEDDLRKHDKNIRNFLAQFTTSRGGDKLLEKTASFLNQLQQKAVKYQDKYKYPGISQDKLFESSYRHKHRNSVACICNHCHGRKDPVCDEALSSSCDDLGCDEDYLVVVRKRLKEQDKEQEPAIYIGAVASGDTVMKSGEDRDRIAEKEEVIAFEMEGAGAWEELPCIVVKGVCDYADCHKNKLWQHFAAATAASATKAILEQYIQTDRGRGRFIQESLRSLFLVPFGRNQNFVGRETILSGLMEKIRPGVNKDDCQRTVIEGLGGVGKTQIALEAVYLLHNEQPDCSIFWVPAVDAMSFENAYRNIGKQLKIKQIDEEADVKLLVKAALGEERSGSWLLVIDNADNTDLLFGAAGLSFYLPFSRTGSILFTTRNHEAAIRLDAESIFNVRQMTDSEALSLLQKGLKESQTSNAMATKRLLDILANLPLAIRQASAYMATKYISTLDYLELCESEPKDMIELLSRDFEDRHQDKKSPVATTWLISFSHIIQHNQLAAEYLKFMSVLAEKDIPKSVIPMAMKLKAIDAIGILQAYAFITQREEEDSFDMHRLVRLAMRNWLEKEGDLEGSITYAVQRLDRVVPFPDYRNKALWVKCLPHAQAVLEHPECSTDKNAEINLLSKVAEGNHLLGRYKIAERMHLQGLKLEEKTLGKDHLLTLFSMNRLAIVLKRQGRYQESEKMHRQTLQLQEGVFGKDHPKTLNSLNGLAIVLSDLGKHEEAEKMHWHIIKLKKEAFGEDHPSLINSMNNLATVLSNLGRNKEAETMHRQTLRQKEETLEQDHPSILESMNNLALVLRRQGKYKEAEKIYQQTVKLKEKVFGKSHPSTLETMNGLAIVLLKLYRYEEAEKIYWYTVKLYEEVFGKTHPLTLDSMSNLAQVFINLGKYEEAEELHRQTLEPKKEVFGKGHPSTLHSMSDLVVVLRGLGKYEEAADMQQQILKIKEEAKAGIVSRTT